MYTDAPTIYQEPQNQVTVQQSMATFTCSASGLPRPMMTWLRVVNGQTLTITQSQYSIVTTPVGTQNQTSTLVVSNTTTNDTTTYICNATNVAGTSNTSATLTVQGEIHYCRCLYYYFMYVTHKIIFYIL